MTKKNTRQMFTIVKNIINLKVDSEGNNENIRITA